MSTPRTALVSFVALIAAGCTGGSGGAARSTSVAPVTTRGGIATPSTSVATSTPTFAVRGISVVANSSASPPPIASGYTAIQYTVAEPSGGPVSIRVQVDTGDGKGFRTATQAPNPPGVPFKTFPISGTTDVAAASSGTTHVLLWDSGADARGATTDVARIRISARARTGASSATLENVKIRNGLALAPAVKTAMPPGASTPSSSQALATADLDHDGDLDVLVLDAANDAVQILAGSAAGAFTVGSSVPIGAKPRALAVGDLDGNGLVDAIVLSASAVHVLLQGPVSTFTARAPIPSASPDSVAVADLSRDGKLDIVVASSSRPSLEIFANPGFAATTVPLPAGTAPTGIATADLDRDGHTDVALSSSDGSVLVIERPANTVRRFTAGTRPSAVAIADMNGDGGLDLVATNEGSGDVSVLLATTPTSATYSSMSLAVGPSPRSLALADLDRDGRPDIVAGGSTVTIAGKNLALPIGAVSVAVGDFDPDGVLDIVAADASSITLVRVARSSPATALDATRRAVSGVDASFDTAAIADLDRDGKQDLVAVDRTGASISVFLALGNGAFAPPKVISGATLPINSIREVALADLDGDGITDLAFADAVRHNLWVLAGKGDGTFPTARSFGTGTFFPYYLAAADVDGDGKRDLVTVSSAGTELRVYRNATPDFVAAVTTALPVAATALAAGDFDGDARAEIVLAHESNDTVSLGARTFPVGKKPAALAILDANGDGKLDLAVTNAEGSSVSVLLGDGTGALRPRVDFATGAGPGPVAVGDLDGDGDADLALGTKGGETVLLGDGRGNFALKAHVANPGEDTATSIAVGDVNGDGDADVAFTTLSTGLPPAPNACVTYLLGDGSGALPSSPPLRSASPIPYLLCDRAPLVVTDINLDGHADVVAGNLDGTVSVFTGSATGALSSPTKVILGAVAVQGLAVFDADRDGKPDIVAVAKAGPSDSLYVRLQTFDGTGARYGWQPPIPVNANGFGSAFDLAAGDVNGDGVTDVVIPNRYENSLSCLLGDGAGSFQLTAPLSLGPTSPSGTGPTAARIADVNHDGAADLLVLDSTGPSVMVLIGPAFTARTTYGVSLQSGNRYARSLAVGDLDRDGHVDFAFCEPGGFGVPGMVYTFRGDGTGAFTAAAAMPHPGPSGLAIGDANDDGRPDLLVTSAVTSFATKPAPLLSFLGQGDPCPIAVGNTPVAVTASDVNGDGRLDFVVANPGEGTIQLIYGR